MSIGTGGRFDFEVEVEERAGLDIFRLNSDVGWLGLQHDRQMAVVGITSSETPAARAGSALGGIASPGWARSP